MLKAAAGAVLTASVLGACAVKEVTEDINESVEVSETTASEESSQTTEPPETSATETSATGAYFGPDFVSTNGELEGQSDYMILRSDYTWNGPRVITDLSILGDDDVIAAAQAYEDEGYTIFNCLFPSNFGDPEYQFYIGFGAESLDGEMLRNAHVWKMNETLFEYFIADTGWIWTEAEEEDDGTCIRYSVDNEYQGEHYYAYFEFNRDTGLMTYYEESTNSDYWNVHAVTPKMFENEDFSDLAQRCVDTGYWLDVSDDFSNITGYIEQYGDYKVESGFTAAYTDDDEDIRIQVISMERDCFDNYFVTDYLEDSSNHILDDDGHVVRYVYIDPPDNYVYYYDRDSEILIIYWQISISSDSPSQAEIISNLQLITG